MKTVPKPSLPSIRSIPVLAQYLPPPAAAHSPALSSRSYTSSSPNIEVLDLTASDESQTEDDVRASPPAPAPVPWKVSKRIGRKLTPRACGPWYVHYACSHMS